MKVKIDIDTRTFVRFWLVVFGFLFVILAVYSARAALVIIGAALFLALALNGPVNKLAHRLPGKSRVLATASAFIIIVSILTAVIFLVIPPIAQQTSKLIEASPEMVRNFSERTKWFGDFAEKYNIQPQVDSAVESMKASTNEFISKFGMNVISGLGSVFSIIGAIFLFLVITFFMLVEGPMWMERLWKLYPDKDRMEKHKRILTKMHTVVSGYVTGQLTVSGIGALCAGLVVFTLAMFFPEIPSNLALPAVAIAFLFSLIPMFGSTIAGAMITILLAFNSLPAAVIFLIYFVVYQQIENNFIAPTIQSKRIEMTPLIVLLAVTIGIYMFGLVGGIISIPIAGCIKVLLDEYLEEEEVATSHKKKNLFGGLFGRARKNAKEKV